MIESAYIKESKGLRESRNPANLPVIYWNGEAKFIPGEQGSLHECSEELGFKSTSKMMEYIKHPIIKFNLKTEPWEGIKSGFKKEEYREINAKWCKRLLLFEGKDVPEEKWKEVLIYLSIATVKISAVLDKGTITPKKYKSICFTKGYPKKGKFEVWKELKILEIKKPNPEWTYGIVPKEEVFAIKF